jgi:hypothetical protein
MPYVAVDLIGDAGQRDNVGKLRKLRDDRLQEDVVV